MRAGTRIPRAALVVALLAVAIRLGLVDRQGLWPDEVFSLAIATGHSLEHPAARADARLGDFVEHEQPRPPADYRRFLAHDQPPAGLARVVRAVRLSDTSPPLYYALLYAWTRLAGTSDAALRIFSVFWAMACLPILWLVSARIGGRRAALPACVLFALAPLSIYYSTEGRMYSLLWFCVVAAAWSMLRLRDRGPRLATFLAWIAASAAGLLTHYFFAFVWGAMLSWWLFLPARAGRRWALVGGLLAALAVAPWYAGVPEDLGRWRVTGDWLMMRPAEYEARRAPLQMVLSYVSARGVWGGGPRADRAALVLYALCGAALFWRRGRRALRGRALLLWLSLAGAASGPLLVDLIRGTYTAAVPRYALAGLPAVFPLMGLALGRLTPFPRWALLTLALVLWLPGWKSMFDNPSRNGSPLREIAHDLDARATEDDRILVHSIPSGVAGVARYLEGAAPMVAWIGQLGRRRVPQSIEPLVPERGRTFLVLVHTVGDPAPEVAYMKEHAQTIHDDGHEAARVIEFARLGSEPSPTPAQSDRR